MKTHHEVSPPNSYSSADDALFELLGLTELSTIEDCHRSPSSSALPSNEDAVAVTALTPPTNCLRPDATLSSAILLRIENALTPSQCSYIIERGYQATNDGGEHFGPTYVAEATHTHSASLKVKLSKPNHHKVCVFKDDTILTWLRRFVMEKTQPHIVEWFREKYNEGMAPPFDCAPVDYIINPRLRLLRYDAIEDDVFLPHYDATTTTINAQGTHYESKLTILCYLNAAFSGGETLFLDSLNPSNLLAVTPSTGQVVVFNHELFHASSQLQYDKTIAVQRPLNAKVIAGGTKFVLRSDVMFHVGNKPDIRKIHHPFVAPGESHCIAETVADIVQQTNCNQSTVDALSDFLNVAVRTFLVPGREKLTSMLGDLGVDGEECIMFLEACEKSTT